VDTSTQETAGTDALGRRTSPRRQRTIEEKLRIVRETHVRGASVATVARRYNVNPNQVFAWRQLYRQGRLEHKSASQDTPMLPVKVSTPTVLPTERARPVSSSRSVTAEQASKLIEIRLANGHSVVLYGELRTKALARVIDLLVRR
jgi:transposase-like protein